MRIAILSFDDWANYAHDMANALRSVGVDCIDIKRRPHAFGYQSESTLASDEMFKKIIRECDIICFMHSWPEYLKYSVNLNKRCIAWHTGTSYRIDPNNCNEIFNPFIEATFTDQCEFMELGAKNIHYVATAINTDKIVPLPWSTKEKVTFAHYPSNSNVKGTSEILRMMEEVDPEEKHFNFIHDTKTLPHREQLKRMSWCDVYIELFKPFLYGKPYGCYGVTAFEAAALGKIVITNNIHEKVYADAYGECGLFIKNTEQEFKDGVKFIYECTTKTINIYQERSRNWVVEKHSYKASGERLIKLLSL